MKTRAPYPSPVSRYRPSNTACRSLSEKKNIFIAFLGVLSFSKTFNFCRYFEVFSGKKLFFGPMSQVWVPPPGPSFELSSIFLVPPTKLTILYLSIKTWAPYPSRISRYGPSNRACRSLSEKKNIFIAFLGVLNVSKTFNFWPVLEGFFGEKIIFFGPRPQVWVPSPGPAFELSAICLARPTKPTTLYFSVNKRTPYPSPLSRYRPSNRACQSLSENNNIFYRISRRIKRF